MQNMNLKNLVKSLNNKPHYNTDIIRSGCDFQIFFQWNFTKELQEKDHKMVIFHESFIPYSTHISPKYIVI